MTPTRPSVGFPDASVRRFSIENENCFILYLLFKDAEEFYLESEGGAAGYGSIVIHTISK